MEPPDAFAEAEAALNLVMPPNLKRILIINGYETETVIANLSEKSNVDEIEAFCRHNLCEIIDEKDLSNYLGIFAKKPQKFTIVSGHRQIISMVANFYKEKWDKKTKQISNAIKRSAKPTLSPPKSSLSAVDGTNSSSASDDNHGGKHKLDFAQERRLIIKGLKTWINEQLTNNACAKIKAEWEVVKKNLDDIEANVAFNESNNLICSIKCFCGSVYKISKLSKTNNTGISPARWVCSNFYGHLKKYHIATLNISENRNSKQKLFSKPTHNLITSYMCPIRAQRHIGDTLKPKGDEKEEPREEMKQESRERSKEKSRKESKEESKKKSREELKDNLSDNLLEDMALEERAMWPLRHNVDDCLASGSNKNLGKSCTKIKVIQDIILGSKDYNAAANGKPSGEQPNKSEKRSFDGNTKKNASNSANETSHTALGQLEELELKSKWSASKYQRNERERRAREIIDPSQTLITDFYSLSEKVSSIIMDSSGVSTDFLKNIVGNIMDEDDGDHFGMDDGTKSSNTPSNMSSFLRKLLEASVQNSQRRSNNNKYDGPMKTFSIYLFYIGGRLLYETLHANLTSILPSISTITRFIDDKRNGMEEGTFDFKGLAEYLRERNLPAIVWISEDGTRVTPKAQYDSRSNKVVGFVLPLKKGVPQEKTYMAISASVIEKFFKTGIKSNYAYVVMAQPLTDGVPAFCIAVFGTNNKFTFQDVLDRWEYMKICAEKFGITIAGFSSDGDPRLLKAMRIHSELPIAGDVEISEWPWYQMSLNKHEECCIQDPVHIMTKLRTRLLKPGIILPMGKYNVKITDVEKLIADVSKEKHLLTACDLKPDDKMNFLAAEKICSQPVINLLEGIPNSDGIRAYLKIMRCVLSSFLDKSLSLEMRLYYIWYAVFFLRLWRNWIRESEKYSITNNFLTNNCYLCIELNAHALIKIILQIKESKLAPNMFCITNFSSQPCEQLFRAARSMTSTFSTVINFSIKDLLHKLDRIKTLNSVVTELRDTFVFPREKKRQLKMQQQSLTEEEVNNLDIKLTVQRALQDALKDTRHMDINTDENRALYIDIPLRRKNDIEDSEEEGEGLNGDDIVNVGPETLKVSNEELFQYELEDEICEETRNEYEDMQLKDYSKKVTDISEDSPFIRINLNEGNSIVIRKSAYCWLLDESQGKVSTDRLRRFITAKGSKQAKSKATESIEKASCVEGESVAKRSVKRSKARNKADKKAKTYNSDESTTDDSTQVEYDDSTDTESFESDIEVNCSRDFCIDDFVIVELVSEKGKRRRFVGKIIKLNPYTCSFLREHQKMADTFVFPLVNDVSDIKPHEIITKLPCPTVLRRGGFRFAKEILAKNYYLD